MSRMVVHPTVMTRTGGSRATRSGRVRMVTIVQPSFMRYASGVQTFTTSPPPS